ncbi:AAA family ATPase [Castellaniella sp.]|uniref:AAA family ATPase n=1 Tax=Castellaniella sp. TaxID=1955812 RepID=UPI002AFE040C|nr:AAA family ATPase [Castellaniella sp.]
MEQHHTQQPKTLRQPRHMGRHPRHSAHRSRNIPATAELVIVRGLPGSGKSTLATGLVEQGYQHFEADMYFMKDGAYCYDANQIRDAHNWCKAMTLAALERGERVVVANTFTRLAEMQPYFEMCKNVRVIEATGQWPNVHGVPAERVQQMADRWEPLPRTPAVYAC